MTPTQKAVAVTDIVGTGTMAGLAGAAAAKGFVNQHLNFKDRLHGRSIADAESAKPVELVTPEKTVRRRGIDGDAVPTVAETVPRRSPLQRVPIYRLLRQVKES